MSPPAQQPIAADTKQSQSAVEEKVDAATPRAPSGSASSNGPGWQRHVDLWNGFSLEYPSGWDVQVTNKAISVCQDTARLTKAMINPVQLQQSMSADTLARDLMQVNYARHQDFAAEKMNAGDVTYAEMQQGTNTDQVLLRFRYREEQTALVGVLSVMVDGSSALVSGFQAPPQNVEALKPIFQRILASFQVEKLLPRTEFVEPTRKAFTASIPIGWQAASRIINDPGGMELCQFWVTDPQRKMRAEAPARTYRFQEAAGLQLHPIRSFLPAPAFLEQVIVPEMRQQYTNVQVEKIVHCPDWIDALLAGAIRQGLPIQGKRPTAASLQCTFTEQQETYRQSIFVYVDPPMPSLPMWNAHVGRIVRAPLDQFASQQMILEGITDSVRLTQEWIQGQQARLQHQQQTFDQLFQRQQMQARQQIAANGQAFMQGQMRRHQMNLAAQQNAFNAHQAVMRDQQQAFHQSNRAFIHNYVQGNEYMYNPASGVVYDVPVGYKYHWTNRMGDVVIASDSPYEQPGYDWQPLDPMKG